MFVFFWFFRNEKQLFSFFFPSLQKKKTNEGERKRGLFFSKNQFILFLFCVFEREEEKEERKKREGDTQSRSLTSSPLVCVLSREFEFFVSFLSLSSPLSPSLPLPSWKENFSFQKGKRKRKRKNENWE